MNNIRYDIIRAKCSQRIKLVDWVISRVITFLMQAWIWQNTNSNSMYCFYFQVQASAEENHKRQVVTHQANHKHQRVAAMTQQGTVNQQDSPQTASEHKQRKGK